MLENASGRAIDKYVIFATDGADGADALTKALLIFEDDFSRKRSMSTRSIAALARGHTSVSRVCAKRLVAR